VPAPPPAPGSSSAVPRSAPAVSRRAIPAGALGGILKIGSSGPVVRDLQRILRRRGLAVATDGIFGRATRRAVERIQLRFGVPVTGQVEVTLQRRLGLQTRRAAAAPGAPSSPGASRLLDTFPVAADNSYSDDYGAPRGQGAHEGNDILADRGAPVVAVSDAVVDRLSRTERGLGGIYVWLRRDDGTEYYYAHLDSLTPGLDEGSRVTVGQRIGANGNTGDARFGAPHVHFEIHPGGSAAVNPFPHLVATDPDR
jgi:murein DD-endopeptidase MepM/ murein hydrolase activator NlpD